MSRKAQILDKRQPFNPIQTKLFGNFVRLGGAKNARALCLLISQQLLAPKLSFKFV